MGTLISVNVGLPREGAWRGRTVRNLSEHEPDDLRRALEIDALPEGWRGSFRALLERDAMGNAGLARAPRRDVAGAGRGLRRAGGLVVPDGRLPPLRERARRRGRGLRA
jgi:hypothetical protein